MTLHRQIDSLNIAIAILNNDYLIYDPHVNYT